MVKIEERVPLSMAEKSTVSVLVPLLLLCELAEATIEHTVRSLFLNKQFVCSAISIADWRHSLFRSFLVVYSAPEMMKHLFFILHYLRPYSFWSDNGWSTGQTASRGLEFVSCFLLAWYVCKVQYVRSIELSRTMYRYG